MAKAPLTRPFSDTVKARWERDPAFRTALMDEIIELIEDQDYDTAMLVLRDVKECLAAPDHKDVRDA